MLVAVEPGASALHDPTAGALPSLLGLLFFALPPGVGRVAAGGDGFAHLVVVIARVQAQVLVGPSGFPCLPGGLHDRWLARQRALHHLHVVSIGPVQHQSDGDALGLGLQAVLDSALSPVSRVAPPSGALCCEPSSEVHSKSNPTTSSYSPKASFQRRANTSGSTHC